MNKHTAALLEQHFDTAFNAPDGLKKLRELILTLAMQGKLVPQDPSDPPASALLKEIEAEKKRLVKEGKIKAPKPLPPVTETEKPYGLPQGWEWVRLGEIGIINPRNEADDSVNAGFVPMPMIPEGYSENHQFEIRPWHEIKKGYTHFADGDVGMAKITPCFENAKSCVFSGLPNGIGAGTTELHIFRNTFRSVIPRFLLYYIKNPHSISKAVPKMTGSAGQKRVPTTYFTEQLFPLPPLPEQHRIVAKIDELMARCDALEKLRTAQSEKLLSVHAAAIQQLLNIAEPAQHQRAQAFLADHFGDLYTVKENVAELRKAILQLAVMGKLVPQDSNDPPASELLKDIEAEKKRLVKEGKIRAPKPLPPVTEQEKPYGLPQGWEWVRLNTVFNTTSGNTFDAGMEKAVGAFAYIKVGDMNLLGNERFITTSSRFIDPDEKMSRSLIPVGSIIFPKRGGAIATNKKRIVTSPIFVDLNTMAITAIQGIETEYAYLWLLTIDLASLNTGTSVPQINHQDIDPLPFPLPPLQEQRRIVAKIDELMTLCDSLDQQIDAATAKQVELLDALMAQV